MNAQMLRDGVKESVLFLASQLIAELGDNLESITVVGSSLTEDYTAGKSDINTVLVLKRIDTPTLKVLSQMARPMKKRKLSPPLLMTTDYIDRSRDVFGIEFLDLQLNHETVYGDDPFSALEFIKADVRAQCERELKASLIRLRQGFIASTGNKKLIRDILYAAVGSLVPLLRAMLWLKEVDRSRLKGEVFVKSGEIFEIDMKTLVELYKEKHGISPFASSGDITGDFERVYSIVDELADIVDRHEE